MTNDQPDPPPFPTPSDGAEPGPAPGRDDEAPTGDGRLSGTEIKRRAVAGVISITLRTVGVRLLGGIGTLVLARLLTESDFGDLAFGTAIVSFGSLFADGGMAAAMLNRDQEPSHEEYRAMLGFHLMLTTLSTLGAAAVGIPFGRPGDLAAIMACALPLDALRVPSSIAVERRLRYGAFVWPQVIEIVVWNGVAVGLVAAGFGVWGVAIAGPLRAFVGSAAMIKVGPLGWMLPKFSLRLVRPLLRFGVLFQASNIVALLRDQGLYFAIVAVSTFDVLGVWNLASSVINTLMVGYLSLWQVAMPGLSRLMETGEPIIPAVERTLRLTGGLTGILCVGLAATAPVSVPLFLGARWHEITPLLVYSAGGILVGATIAPVATGYFYAIGRAGLPLRIVIAHTVVQFAVSLPLLHALGTDALGIGGCAAGVTDGLLLGWALRRERVKVVRCCAAPIGVAIVAGGVGLLVCQTIGPQVPALLASGLAAEIIYLAGLMVTGPEIVSEILDILRRHVLGRFTLRRAVAR